jgi:hypothetical protein
MVATAVPPTRVETSAPSPGWRRAALIAALVAPVLFLAGQALLPSLPDDWDRAFGGMLAHRDQLLAARLLTAASGFLFVPAIAVLLAIVPRGGRGSRTLRAGAVVFGVGTFFNALSQAVEAYATQAATASTVPHPAGSAMLKTLGSGVSGIPLGFWSIPPSRSAH